MAGKRHWVQVSATLALTHYAVHLKCSKQALDAIGILLDFSDVSVHVGWRSYWAEGNQHATCTAHLFHDLTFLLGRTEAGLGQQMKISCSRKKSRPSKLALRVIPLRNVGYRT
jgi:hypothetical protein